MDQVHEGVQGLGHQGYVVHGPAVYVLYMSFILVHDNKACQVDLMNFKNIVWFTKAVSYFVLQQSLGNKLFK